MIMNFDYQIESDDDEWFEGLESDQGNIEMGSAVQINDPISTLGLKAVSYTHLTLPTNGTV